MKTILVPTDFSKNAGNALKFAMALAEKENAGIIVLHAWEIAYPISEIPLGTDMIAEKMSEAEIDSIRQLNRLCAEMHASANVKLVKMNKQGSVVDTVLDIANEEAVDLVIMGTKGASGLEEIFMGSNTAKVIQKVSCPIIAVPEAAVFRGLKKITYATNYQTGDMRALKKVAGIAALFKASITLLHVTDKDYSNGEAQLLLESFAAKVRRKIQFGEVSFRLMYGSDIESKLDEYTRDNQTDLLVMSTVHPNLFDRLFSNNLVKTMSYHIQVPLMVFHHPDNSIIFL